MDKEFWLSRWQKNEIGFHNDQPHHYLQRFFSLLQTGPGDPVFVPLCGKSSDLVWLRGQGQSVIGVELSRTAVSDFFRENGLNGQWQGPEERARFCAEGYTIYCGDFFELAAAELAGACAVYDRGSLVALPITMRKRYAEKLAALLPSASRILLVSYEYPQAETFGPPFSVSPQEIEALFGDAFLVETLLAEDALCSHQGLVARGLSKLTEFAALLIRR